MATETPQPPQPPPPPPSSHQPTEDDTTTATKQPQSYISGSKEDVPWYNASEPRIQAPMATLLADYAGIPPSQQIKHVSSIREKAYAVHPYPCLGLWAFLRLHLQSSPLFPQIVAELQSESKSKSKSELEPLFVDLGTGLGQEVRSLIAAGAPVGRVRGVELEEAFNEFGFELFNDRERLGECMLVGDILKEDGVGSLEGLYGRVSVLYAASFLHLWDWAGQVDVGCRMVRLMQDRGGVRMLGRQIGSAVAKAKIHETNKNGMTMWKHDVDSFERLWVEIGKLTGTKWHVTAELGKPYSVMDQRTGIWWHDPDTRTIVWSTVRAE